MIFVLVVYLRTAAGSLSSLENTAGTALFRTLFIWPVSKSYRCYQLTVTSYDNRVSYEDKEFENYKIVLQADRAQPYLARCKVH